jgi:AraC-like DNA-binding protein
MLDAMECVVDPGAHDQFAEPGDDLVLVQLTAGELRAERRITQCGDFFVHRQQFRTGGLLRDKPRPGRLIVGWFDERTAGVTVGGRNLGPHHLFTIRDEGVDICTLGGARVSWLEVASATFGDELANTRLASPGTAVAIREPAELHPLQRLVERAEDAALAADIGREVRRVLRTAAETAQTATRTHRLELLRAAEAYMWLHVDEPISVDGIARAISCSRRYVICLFHAAFGLGPITYFKVQRLNAVRRELRRLRNSSRRINDIAADYSFWHMGHFGADYRRLFGETPSETRRWARAGNAPSRL